MLQDELGVQAEVAGLVPASRRVHDSITRRKPILLLDPYGPASWEIRRAAERLLAQPLPAKRLVMHTVAALEPEEPGPDIAADAPR
jgi:hypothetical protein